MEVNLDRDLYLARCSICGKELIRRYTPKLEPNQTSCSFVPFPVLVFSRKENTQIPIVLYRKLGFERISIPTQLFVRETGF